MISLILFLLALLIIDPVTDWYIIEVRKRSVKHARGFVLFSLGVVVVFAGDLASWVAYEALGRFYYLSRLSLLVLLPGLRWVIHDGLLNIMRGNSPDYIGDDIDPAKSDKILYYFSTKHGITPAAGRFLFLAASLVLSGIIYLML